MSGDYTPKVGHRVRVTSVVEGVVTEEGPAWFDIKTATGTATIYAETTSDRTIERLPDPEPEPEWQPGDVAVDAFGDTYAYLASGWHIIADHHGQHYDSPGRHDPLYRPMKLLVRDGKPVTS